MTVTPLPSDELAGRLIAGRYRIQSLIGRGGMGAVWAARDEQGNVDVAVKVVRAALLEDAQALARFKREQKVIKGLDHPGIVRSLDSGEDQGMLWIAMELLCGKTLRQRLDGRGRMSWDESLACAKAILSALAAAHDAGVVHRDLKPDNVMLLDDGRIKLLDFGVAKQSHLESSLASSMTGTGFIVGTPGYVAPEVVLEGRNDDPRSDLYAFGVMWFEMLTGQKPFTAKTAFALAMRHAHEPAPRASALLPFAPIPLAVENLVAQLMAKSPDERPPSANAVLDLIDAIERGAAKIASGTSCSVFDATETDIRDFPNGTAVVPVRLTPTVDRGAPTAPAEPAGWQGSAATPATGMASAPQAPLDSSPFRGLRKALPTKRRAALVVFAGFALIGITAVAVGVMAKVLDVEPNKATAPAPVFVEPPAPRPASIVHRDAMPTSHGTVEDSTRPHVNANKDDRDGMADRIQKGAKGEQQAAKKKSRDSQSPTPSQPMSSPSPPQPLTSSPVLTRVRTVPVGSSISVDGRPPVDGGTPLYLTPGEHTLKFDNGGVLKIHVKAGECTGYIVSLEGPEPVIVKKTYPPCS